MKYLIYVKGDQISLLFELKIRFIDLLDLFFSKENKIYKEQPQVEFQTKTTHPN